MRSLSDERFVLRTSFNPISHSHTHTHISCNEDTVTIVDVTDWANPVALSRNRYTDTGYTHQGWLTEDHNYFLFGDETDEGRFLVDNTKTLVLQVRSLRNPTFVPSYFNPASSAVDHNQYVHQGLVYQANYMSGVRILQHDDTGRMVERGFFDISPGERRTFNGAWSVYPFLPSGTVLVSGIEQGLYVLESDIEKIEGLAIPEYVSGEDSEEPPDDDDEGSSSSECLDCDRLLGPGDLMRIEFIFLCFEFCVPTFWRGFGRLIGLECGAC